MCRRYGNVPPVKQAMNIAAQKKAIGRLMRSMLRIRPDVSGVQRRQGPLASNSASSMVIVSHEDPKGPLPEARSNESGFAPAASGLPVSDEGRRWRLRRLKVTLAFVRDPFQIAVGRFPKAHNHQDRRWCRS